MKTVLCAALMVFAMVFVAACGDEQPTDSTTAAPRQTTVAPVVPSPVPETPTSRPASPNPTAASIPDATPGPSATAAPTSTPPTATPLPTSTPLPTATPIPEPTVLSGDWDLIFSDDFDTLDTDVWEPGWFAARGFSPSVNDNGAACFHPKQATISDGMLVLSIDAEDDDDCRVRSGERGDYVAGLVNTRESFTFSYGYAEARIFLASDGGPLHNWPAFWHTGFDWPRTGEIDIAEGLSGGVLCSVYHHLGADGEPKQERGCSDDPDPGGWHVFAADWREDEINFYYDGELVFSTRDGVVGSPHYLILDYTVRNDGSVVAPSSMLVDYVRVWQQANN